MDAQEFSLRLERREGYRFAIDFEQPPVPPLLVDEPKPLGDGAGPNAARLLGAAVGNCLSASLLYCLERAHVPVHGMETRVHGTIERNDRGRLRITGLRVHLEPDVAPEDRLRMERCLGLFEDFCIVTESVRQGIHVGVEVATPVPG